MLRMNIKLDPAFFFFLSGLKSHTYWAHAKFTWESFQLSLFLLVVVVKYGAKHCGHVLNESLVITADFQQHPVQMPLWMGVVFPWPNAPSSWDQTTT